jgi:hypothetical protein
MSEKESLEQRLRQLDEKARQLLEGRSSRPTSEPSVKRGRTELGRLVRTHVDNVREKLSTLIDASIEGGAAAKAALIDIREETALLESALKQWDALPPTEDSCEDLDWRKGLQELASLFAEMCSIEVDVSFPEHGYAKRYSRQREIGVAQDLTGTQPRRNLDGLLESLAADKTGLFSYEYDWERKSLTCLWKSMMRVTFRFQPREVTSIRVVADAESSWPSKYDVFRELERQSKQAMRGAWIDLSVKDVFDLIAYLVRWFDQRKNLFSLNCSTTKKFLAFGAVGERGKLEARPPMNRTKAEDKTEIKVGFGDGLM